MGPGIFLPELGTAPMSRNSTALGYAEIKDRANLNEPKNGGQHSRGLIQRFLGPCPTTAFVMPNARLTTRQFLGITI